MSSTINNMDQLFTQTPPALGNQYQEDERLWQWLERYMPANLLQTITPQLMEMGALAAGDLFHRQLSEYAVEPSLTQWDAWGRRVDRIELTPLWRKAARLAAEYGLVANGYAEENGPAARLHQFALAYLFIPSTDVYGCPLAMTDGAVKTLKDNENVHLIARALPHLLSRDPEQFWTSGQWMTETTGGSDVGGTETEARRDDNGQWRLHGRKWFTSAATSEMTLTLARPQGAAAGSKGLALFYLEPRDAEGQLQNIEILRLKDKLGTRKLPTAELWLNGAPAEPVAGLDRGVANITPMLTITRTWNAVTAASLLHRGVALSREYAAKRSAFGQPIDQLPLHRSTLAQLETLSAAVFHLAFLQVRLLGQVEHGAHEQADLLRLITPIAKLATAKQCVAGLSEVLESFGGAGYLEDTGLPSLLRDAQVLPIWEGTTNVLSLDLLRAMASTDGLKPIHAYLDATLPQGEQDQALAARIRHELAELEHWFSHTKPEPLQAGARQAAMKLAHIIQVSELLAHGAWTEHSGHGNRSRAMAHLLASQQHVTLPADLHITDNILA